MHPLSVFAGSLRTSFVRKVGAKGRRARSRAGATGAAAALSRAAAEPLERRTLLSLTAHISGPPAVTEGASYTLNLSVTGSDAGSVAHWDVNWGDWTERIMGNPTSVSHVYPDGPNAYAITASATTTGAVTSATVALARMLHRCR